MPSQRSYIVSQSRIGYVNSSKSPDPTSSVYRDLCLFIIHETDDCFHLHFFILSRRTCQCSLVIQVYLYPFVLIPTLIAEVMSNTRWEPPHSNAFLCFSISSFQYFSLSFDLFTAVLFSVFRALARTAGFMADTM